MTASGMTAQNFYLGRVPRAKIGNLHAADWQFYANGGWTARR